MSKSKPPVKKYKVGHVNATVWHNEGGEKGPYYSVNFDRRYKDGEEYKTVTSFSRDDLKDLITAAELAIASIPLQERIVAGENAGEPTSDKE